MITPSCSVGSTFLPLPFNPLDSGLQKDFHDQFKWTVNKVMISMSTSRLAKFTHLVSSLEGDFSGPFHAMNLINNPYNFVKFNQGAPYVDPFSPAGAHNLHFPSGQEGELGSLSPHSPKADNENIEQAGVFLYGLHLDTHSLRLLSKTRSNRF